MKKIIAFAGSNSKKSINKKLVTHATSLIEGMNIKVLDLNDFPMPIFGVDLENESGFPKSTLELSKLFDESDGFVVSLAEHNGSYSAVFKNTFDWLSRIEGNVWRDKPVLLMSTSPGGRGGKGVMETALNRFPRNGAIISGHFSLPSFNNHFSPDNGITDADLALELKNEIKKFEQSVMQTSAL